MEKLFKWFLPLLILAEIILVWGGLLDAGTAVLVAGAVELLLLLVGGRQIFMAVRRYRHNRAAGLDVEAALEDGLAVLLPRPLARLVALEPRIWIILFRRLFRHRPLAANEFSYHKRSALGALMVVALVSAPVELLIFELLIPWEWLRWLLLIVAIYGTIWLAGLWASLQVLPHRLEEDGLRLHYGVLASGYLPYENIAEVLQERRSSPDAKEGRVVAAAKQEAYLATGGRTDITLRLREPAVLHGLLAPVAPALTIHLAADDPAGLANALRQRISGS